jgi:glutaredoxin
MKFKFILALAVGAMCLTTAHAQKLYKWVDGDGNVSYHDRPPREAGYRVEEKIIRNRSSRASDANSEVVEKYPVVLYTTRKCASCDLARAYLEKRKVPFTEKGVDDDRALQQELMKRTGQLAVPTISIGDKVMNGYMESLLAGELDQAGYQKLGQDKSGEEPEDREERPEQ